MNFIRLKVWWLWMFERINWYSWCYGFHARFVLVHARDHMWCHTHSSDREYFLLHQISKLNFSLPRFFCSPEPLVAALLVSQVKDEILLLRFHSFILTFKDTLQHLTCWAWFFHLNVRHETGCFILSLKLWTFFGNFKRSYKTWVEMSFRKCVDES